MILPVVLCVLILCAGLWLFLIAPAMEKKTELSELWKYDYAHRGLHCREGGAPENTLAAFRLAVQYGFGIELDLRLTADRQVVAHHDPSLFRTCGADKRISELSFKELQGFRLFQTEERIPSLSQVLSLVEGRVPLILELKSCENYEELCRLSLRELGGYGGLFCVESFDPRILRWFRLYAPQTARGQLMTRLKGGKDGIGAFKAFCGRNLLTNFLTRPHFTAYEFQWRNNLSLKTAKWLFHMREASWTLKTWEELQKAKQHGNLCIFEGVLFQKEPERQKDPTRGLSKGLGATAFRERKVRARALESREKENTLYE